MQPVDAELGDLTRVSRTELERVAVRRLAIGDPPGAKVCTDELARRYAAQSGTPVPTTREGGRADGLHHTNL